MCSCRSRWVAECGILWPRIQYCADLLRDDLCGSADWVHQTPSSSHNLLELISRHATFLYLRFVVLVRQGWYPRRFLSLSVFNMTMLPDLATRFLLVSFLVETNRLPSRQGVWGCILLCGHVSTRHQAVNFGQNSLEGSVDTRRIQSRSLDESQVVLFRKGHCLVGLNSSQMTEIGLVSDQHDDNVRFGMVTKFFQPTLNIFESCVFGNVIDQERSNGTSEGSGAMSGVSTLTTPMTMSLKLTCSTPTWLHDNVPAQQYPKSVLWLSFLPPEWTW